jgi:hypothetical protein
MFWSSSLFLSHANDIPASSGRLTRASVAGFFSGLIFQWFFPIHSTKEILNPTGSLKILVRKKSWRDGKKKKTERLYFLIV